MTDTITELKNSFCALLEKTVGAERFRLWFSEADTFSCNENELRVFNQSEFMLERIRSQFSAEIAQTASILGVRKVVYRTLENSASQDDSAPQNNPSTLNNSALDNPASFEAPDSHPAGNASGNRSEGEVDQSSEADVYSKPGGHEFNSGSSTVDSQTSGSLHLQSQSNSNTSDQRIDRLNLQNQYALERFVFDGNDLVRTGAEMVMSDPGRLSPFTVFGPSGTGKTHLLRGLYDQVRRKRLVGRALHLTAEQFTSQFVGSINGGGLAMFRQKCRDIDMLFLDDVDHFAGKTATINEFQYTIDTLLRRGKQIILGSSIAPSELDFLGTALANRLASGLTCAIQIPGSDGRLRILKQWCHTRALNIRNEVLEFVALNIRNDVRKLSGCLNLIHAHQIVGKETVNIERAREAIKEFLPGAQQVSLSQIEKVVCETCGVQSDALKSRRKQQAISTARMLAIWLSRKHTSAALNEIGSFYGGRSHSTVISARKTVEGWIKEDRRLNLGRGKRSTLALIQRIESELKVG